MNPTIDQLQIEIQASASNAASELERTAGALGVLKKAVTKGLLDKLSNLSAALDGIKAPITVNMNVKGMDTLRGAVDSAIKDLPQNATVTPLVDGAVAESEFIKVKNGAEQASDGLRTIKDMATSAKTELGATAAVATETGNKIKQVGESAKRSSKGLGKFVESLKRIALYRFVRFILKQITTAIKEGIQNLAQYSRAIGGIDASRANATMSQFASIGMQVKNTIGAALMPVLKAIMPVIQTLANWFIIAANAVNQFFAAISGASTWSKATKGAVDYAGGLNKAAGSAKKLKGQLAGFDELNVIQQESGGGGGGGGGGTGFGDMFEEVEIGGDFKKLIEEIKTFFTDVWDKIKQTGAIDRLTESWNRLKDAVKGLLGNPALKEAFQWVLALAGILIIDALASVVEILADVVNYTNAIINGDIAGIVNEIKNTLADVLALPFGLIADIIDAIFGTDMRGWLDGVVAAVKEFDLAAWFVRAWANIADGIEKAWSGIEGFFAATIPSIIHNIQKWFSELPGKIAYEIGFTIGKLTAWKDDAIKWAKEKVPEIISGVVAFFAELPAKIKEKLNAFKEKIIEWKNDAIKWFKEELPGVLNSVIDWFAKLPDALKNIGKNMIYGLWNGIMSVGGWLWSKIKAFFGGAWDIVQGIFRGFGTGYEAGYSSVPRFASGGYVDAGQLFIAREAGPEMVGTMGGRTAVANNDQIVEAIERGVYRAMAAASGSGGGDITVPVYIDGELIETHVTRRQGGKSIRSNGRA